MSMNFDCLMEYLSRNLHTFVQVFTAEGIHQKTICVREDLEIRCEDEAVKEILEAVTGEYPVILTDKYSIAYGAAASAEHIFVLGPVLLTSGNACRSHFSARTYETEEILSLYQCGTSELLREVLLLHNLFRENSLTMEEAAGYNCVDEDIKDAVQEQFVEIIFHNQEYGTRHNPYDQEIREVASIRNGDVEQLKKSWAEDYVGQLGTVGKTPLRNHQNLGIILVTLASRAAMEGGVMPEVAFSLSDSYINKIEEALSPEEALGLGREAEYQYTLLVQEIKKERMVSDEKQRGNSRVSQCKDYIFSHLHEKISTSDIAKKLYLNADYLSDMFRRSEGITISEYILQEKMKLVKNMLVYSQYSYNEIASYLGFSSQSHLGTRFKKYTGMTLHQYREKYGRKEFGHS